MVRNFSIICKLPKRNVLYSGLALGNLLRLLIAFKNILMF